MRPQEKVCGYATTFVRDPRAKGGPRPFSVWVGASGAVKLFFDGVPVMKDPKYRDLDSDRAGVALTMTEGWHRLTVKVCGDEDAPMFSLRLGDQGGSPDPALESDPDPAHAKEAASVRFKKGDKPPPSVVVGPVPSFEKLVAGDAPAALEA